MSNDLYLVFSHPAGTIDLEMFNASQDEHVLENLEVPGLLSCRRYAIEGARGVEYPARFRFVSVYEVDKPREELLSGLRERSARRTRPGWLSDVTFSAQLCENVDGGPDPTKPDHLFFVFSTPPSRMTFDEYNEWYREHIQENIRASGLLREGWRFRLTGGDESSGEVPQHLALYALEGSSDEMLADTNRAVESGATGMIDDFHAFANFDAIALGDRQLAG